MPRIGLEVLAAPAVLLAALIPATPARAQSVPGVPEPGDQVQPVGAAGTPAELEAKRPEEEDDTPRPGWVILPGINYAPETGLSASGTLLRHFRLKHHPDARLSSLGLHSMVSFNRRGEVNFDPVLWMAGDRLNLTGTLGVSYFDYPYYGIGNDSPAAAREDFTSFRTSARLEPTARMWGPLYAGLVYDFRHEEITAIEEGGMIDGGVVGDQGGFLSGVGGILRWDSRDHSLAPRAGGVLSFSPRMYRRGLGSDYDFGRLVVDGSWFFGLGGSHVVAFDGRGDFRTGDPPFDHLSQAGGSRLLRGMIEGRFRDNHYLAGQVEYRFPLFWRFGGVAFGGVGRVADQLRDFEITGWKWAAGGGLRFAVNRKERINVRVDVGATAEGRNVYLAIGEAF